jgi:hypothetical protein
MQLVSGVVVIDVRSYRQIFGFAQVAGALTLAPDDSIFGHRKLIIELAAQDRLPTIYQFRAFAADGGLLS